MGSKRGRVSQKLIQKWQRGEGVWSKMMITRAGVEKKSHIGEA